jgi:ribonuclease BN (tRNA processing enzyme)
MVVGMMRNVRLSVIGCSPAWPNPGGVQSGYLIEGAGRLLLDCGPGVLARMRADEAWPRVDAIAITHFHLDHCADLVPWAFGAMFGPGAGLAKPELYLPPEGGKWLADLAIHLGGWPDLFEDCFAVREYAEGVPSRVAGFELVAQRVQHYTIESYGFRVSGGGRTLAYSGDSGPDPRLADLARDCDLFVCEATLEEPEESLRGHLTLGEAVAAFEASGARRLLITHRPDERPADGTVELARDGLTIDL